MANLIWPSPAFRTLSQCFWETATEHFSLRFNTTRIWAARFPCWAPVTSTATENRTWLSQDRPLTRRHLAHLAPSSFSSEMATVHSDFRPEWPQSQTRSQLSPWAILTEMARRTLPSLVSVATAPLTPSRYFLAIPAASFSPPLSSPLRGSLPHSPLLISIRMESRTWQ